jgi:hypothetical protein
MPNCKVGDLAVVISSGYEENIGALVTVLSAYTAPEHFANTAGRWMEFRGSYPNKLCWVVKALGRPLHNNEHSYRIAPVQDFRLQPLRGNKVNAVTQTANKNRTSVEI